MIVKKKTNNFDEPINRFILMTYKQVGGQDTDPPEPSNESLPRYAQGGRLRTLETNVSQNVEISCLKNTNVQYECIHRRN